MRDQIGYESYLGALRGARGTLWSMAGNSLDKASLLVALLRASGIPAQYASGTLNQSQEQQLILSMFPAQTQLDRLRRRWGDVVESRRAIRRFSPRRKLTTGCSSITAPALSSDADPDFAGARIGQTFTANQGTFAEVADTLHHHVTVKLNAELYQQGFFGPTGIDDRVSESDVHVSGTDRAPVDARALRAIAIRWIRALRNHQ